MTLNYDLIKKYDIRGPRYTSYPPATEFKAGIDHERARSILLRSNEQQPANLSFYFHVPFCPQLCHFCGCNSCAVPARKGVEEYMQAMIVEMEQVLDLLDPERPVTQIHWGGGTPNSISYRLIDDLMSRLLKRVKLAPQAEIAMECNPAYLKPEHIPQLRAMGFNRLSLGLQDFNEEVLRAVNRAASRLPVQTLVELIRKAGFDGVNLDFIYGLPLQTPEQFRKTIEEAITIRPDRLVTFSYAHVPWVKSSQQRLEVLSIPTGEEKFSMLQIAVDLMNQAGYLSIGMDHFALPGDALGKASQSATLHRNFQGYCTRETTGQVYAFGASSISQLESAYLQNVREWQDYIKAINETGWAFERAYELSEDERVIRSSITELMCNGLLSFDEIGLRYNIDSKEVKRILDYDRSRFGALEEDGLTSAGDDELRLTRQGMQLARVVAMKIDPQLNTEKTLFSKTI